MKFWVQVSQIGQPFKKEISNFNPTSLLDFTIELYHIHWLNINSNIFEDIMLLIKSKRLFWISIVREDAEGIVCVITQFTKVHVNDLQ